MKIGKRYLMAMLWGVLSVGFFVGGDAYGGVNPLGTWDFTVSGVKSGSAYLTFNSDNTVTGYILVTAAIFNNKISTVGFGYATLAGQWQVYGNQVVGFLYNPPSETLRLDITGFWGSVGADGASFAMTGATADGNVTFSGVPFVPSATLPATWTIQKQTKGKITFTEIFSATPDSSLGGGNLYDLVGQGSDICIFGNAALSRGNNLSISFSEYTMPSNGDCSKVDTTSGGTLSAGTGKINLQTDRATLTGYQEGSPYPKVAMPVLCQ